MNAEKAIWDFTIVGVFLCSLANDSQMLFTSGRDFWCHVYLYAHYFIINSIVYIILKNNMML